MPRYELLSIIVPSLNEEGTLRELFERTRAVIPPDQPFEFIVVDDGSVDGSFAVLEALHAEYPHVVVIRHGFPLGKSMALMHGFDAARGDVAVTMDADLQDLPEAIPALLDKLDEGYDLVNGWRTRRCDRLAKRLVSRVYNLLVRWLLGCRLHDINCGFKAMRRSVYRRLELRGDAHRLIPAIAARSGFRVAEVPVPHAPRLHGRSRYHLLRFNGILDIFALRAGEATAWKAFHAFVQAALVFWGLAVVFTVLWLGLSRPSACGSGGTNLPAALCGAVAVWAALVGTLLPALGLHLDIVLRQGQARHWRKSLIERTLDARK